MKVPDVTIITNITVGILFPELISYLNKHSFAELSNYAHTAQLISLVQTKEPNFVCKSAFILAG